MSSPILHHIDIPLRSHLRLCQFHARSMDLMDRPSSPAYLTPSPAIVVIPLLPMRATVEKLFSAITSSSQPPNRFPTLLSCTSPHPPLSSPPESAGAAAPRHGVPAPLFLFGLQAQDLAGPLAGPGRSPQPQQ
jgi:hypothetical protein